MCSGPIDDSSSERASEDGWDGGAETPKIPGRETLGEKCKTSVLFLSPFSSKKYALFPSLNFTNRTFLLIWGYVLGRSPI